MKGVTAYGHSPECHVAFLRGDFITLKKIPVSIIELPKRRFQMIPGITTYP